MKENQFTNRSTMNFGANLARYMQKKGLTIKWLADQTGKSVRTVQSWLSCGTSKYGRFPETLVLLELRQVLHVNIDTLLKK